MGHQTPKNTVDRRRFLKTSCAAACVVTLPLQHVFANAAEKLSEDDQTAQAFGYKHDASAVDLEKFPRAKDTAGVTQTCKNCALFQNAASPDAEWATCPIFQNKLVAADGWCNAWAPKAAG